MRNFLQFLARRWAVVKFAVEDSFLNFENPGGGRRQIEGADIASAAVIAPDHLIHRVTGVAAIDTITLPYASFQGFIILIPTGASSLTAAGNITTARALTVNMPMLLVWSSLTQKWHPGPIS